MPQLAGKVAIVTGVSHAGQVGQTVAARLASEGASVAVVARTRENVEARAAELRAAGARATAYAIDLTDETAVAGLFEAVRAEFGRVDILVNLAGGLTRYKPVTEHTLEDWQSEMRNNLLTAFLCARAAFPILREHGGSIVNFSRAGTPQANMVAYSCAKAGIDALTRTLALEGREHRIRVNAIAPGIADTASNIASMKPKDTSRWARREDIAEAVLFLVSPSGAGVTGQTLPVTGWSA